MCTEHEKVYIPGVRKISWETGEMCEFASSFVSAMQCLGEDFSYEDVMGVCGAAFRFTLNPGKWDFSNYGIRNFASDKDEPIRRTFAAAGYNFSLFEPGTFQEDAGRIMDSLERGVPVLAFRVVGPSDCCILTGYDEGGEVLLGWSTFQDIPDDHDLPHDPTGYFRKPGWHDNIPGYILIGNKVDRPELRQVYRGALEWAVYLMRTPALGDKAAGLEGLQVWAEEMTRAEFFPPGDQEILEQRYVSAAINMTMLRDHLSAEAFLRRIMEQADGFRPELSEAVKCYARVRQLRAGMDALMSDDFSEPARKSIRDAAIRKAYADAILSIRDCEADAVSHIERLLQRMM